MSKFIDPVNVEETLSWSAWNVANISYISSRVNENAASSLHFAGPNHHPNVYRQKTVPLDETNSEELMIQVALLIPTSWCKAMTDGNHFNDGFYCKSKVENDLTPMAMNKKWSEFKKTKNKTVEALFEVSKLGHMFKLVWVPADPEEADHQPKEIDPYDDFVTHDRPYDDLVTRDRNKLSDRMSYLPSRQSR